MTEQMNESTLKCTENRNRPLTVGAIENVFEIKKRSPDSGLMLRHSTNITQAPLQRPVFAGSVI